MAGAAVEPDDQFDPSEKHEICDPSLEAVSSSLLALEDKVQSLRRFPSESGRLAQRCLEAGYCLLLNKAA